MRYDELKWDVFSESIAGKSRHLNKKSTTVTDSMLGSFALHLRNTQRWDVHEAEIGNSSQRAKSCELLWLIQ